MLDIAALGPFLLLLGSLVTVSLFAIFIALTFQRQRAGRIPSRYTLVKATPRQRHTLLIAPSASIQVAEPEPVRETGAETAPDPPDVGVPSPEFVSPNGPSLRLTAVAYADLSRQQRKAIGRQAQVDYEQARGTAHRTLLEASRKQVEAQLRQEEAEALRLRQELEALGKQHQAELRAALELHFVHDRFDEVPGIGRALKVRILAATQARSLADLRYAASVPGVGEGRMAAITAWADDLRRQIPTRLSQPFPGRDPIDQRFAAQRSRLQQALAQNQNRSEPLRTRLAALDQHIAALKAVTPQTFIVAASGDLEAQRAALHYTIGLFAEWEPVPGWFQTLVEGGSA